MKLIFENDSQLDYGVDEELNEATGRSEKKYRIKGVFSTIGERNRNGRIYPRNIWESEVSKYQNNFQTGSLNLLCEWQHPPRSKVDPMEAVAKIEKLYIKDKYVMGEAVLLNNPKANQLKSLIDAGIKLSVSSRGVGNVKNGIVENFNLITYDLVDEPSDYAATMNGMVESYRLSEGVLEDKEFEVSESGIIEEVAVCSTKACHLFEKTDIHAGIKEKLSTFLKELSEKEKEKECEDPAEEIKDGEAKFSDGLVTATFTFYDPESKELKTVKKVFDSTVAAAKYAELMSYTLEYTDGDGKNNVFEMINTKHLPDASVMQRKNKNFRCTCSFKDPKGGQKRIQTLYFGSKEDALKYADIKSYKVEGIKDLTPTE